MTPVASQPGETQMTDDLQERARTDHGDALQAIEWVLNVNRDGQHDDFLRAWQQGDLGEWPEFYEWLDAQPAFATPRPVETGEAIQADRDAAAWLYTSGLINAGSADANDKTAAVIAAGEEDGRTTVQAFKNHRLAFASPTPEPSSELRAALKLSIMHNKHMAAWISKSPNGYCFEALGEDMPGIEAALNDGAPK